MDIDSDQKGGPELLFGRRGHGLDFAMTFSRPYPTRRFERHRSFLETLTKNLTRIIYPALFFLALMTAPGTAQGQTDPEKWLKEAENAYGRVTSYTAIFHKQQRVDGKLLEA